MDRRIVTVSNTTVKYEIRGAGPNLVLIPGGAGHGGVFGPLADRLADRFRVISVHTRTASGDPVSADQDQHPTTHAADIDELISLLCDQPPIVFGSSSGAITALELRARHPERVRLVIAHEPPLVGQFDATDPRRLGLESVAAVARTSGTDPATAVMADALAPNGTEEISAKPHHPGDWSAGYADTTPEPPTPELTSVFSELSGLRRVFLERILVPFATHELDLVALRHARPLPRIAAGIESGGWLPYSAAVLLAERLGSPLVELPGGHLGPVERPRQFADALAALIGEHRCESSEDA